MKRLSLKIYGRVQGVFFRAKTQEKAQNLGLVGWVKNASDGTVQILAEGEDGNLQRFFEFCKSGPEYASVSGLDESWQDIDGTSFDQFEVTH